MMALDVGTTPRRNLTPTQRLALFEAHNGLCQLCGNQICAGEKWISEHMRALGLGGSNDLDNLAPVHKTCADAKTSGEDIPRMAKAKAQKRSALGIKPEHVTIQSRGFTQTAKREPKQPLPPRALYQNRGSS